MTYTGYETCEHCGCRARKRRLGGLMAHDDPATPGVRCVTTPRNTRGRLPLETTPMAAAFTVSVDVARLERLDNLCSQRGVSRAQVVRDALDAYVGGAQ